MKYGQGHNNVCLRIACEEKIIENNPQFVQMSYKTENKQKRKTRDCLKRVANLMAIMMAMIKQYCMIDYLDVLGFVTLCVLAPM